MKKRSCVFCLILCLCLAGCGAGEAAPFTVLTDYWSHAGLNGKRQTLSPSETIWQEIPKPSASRDEKDPFYGSNIFLTDGDDGAREAALKQTRTQLMNGKGPDLYIAEANHFDAEFLFPDLEKAMRSGALMDLTDFVENSPLRPHLNSAVLQAGQLDGRQYVIPLSWWASGVLISSADIERFGLDRALLSRDTASFYTELAAKLPARELSALRGFADDPLWAMGQKPLDYDRQAVTLDEGTLAPILTAVAPVWAAQGSSTGVLTAASPATLLLAALNRGQEGKAMEYFPVPGERGGVTACVHVFACVRAGSPYGEESWHIIETLLGKGLQGGTDISLGGMYWGLPMYKGCIPSLALSLWSDSSRSWIPPSPEEVEALLPPAFTAQEGQITHASFYQYGYRSALSEEFKEAFLPYCRGQQTFSQCAEALEAHWRNYVSE